jgi:hypothetical protein
MDTAAGVIVFDLPGWSPFRLSAAGLFLVAVLVFLAVDVAELPPVPPEEP